MMERGVVSITFGQGRIATTKLPTPVGFSPASFPNIVNDEDVLFERDSANPEWATNVVEASAVASLVKLGVPQAGLTRVAAGQLLTQAALLVADAHAAPNAEQKRARLKVAGKRMAALAEKGRQAGTRLGVKDVRKAFE
jgi:hypothetical protein